MAAGDLALARSTGVDLPVIGYVCPDTSYASALTNSGTRYIDNTLWTLVHQYVPKDCESSTAPCELSASQEGQLLAKVRAHLDEVGADPRVAGFYVLDDYPGNIKGLLVKVHDLIGASDRTTGMVRPTICAFWVSLDFRIGTAWTSSTEAFHRALLNYSPTACDAVSIYSYAYAYGARAEGYDWAMSRLLPDVKASLAALGWTPASPLIGTPMAFTDAASGFPTPPTADELRTEIRAFCAGGATAIMPYAWRVSNEASGNLDLATDAALRSGLAAGIGDCRVLWQHG